MELVIDRGVKSYDVKDIDGTLLGVIKINPADIGISGRFVSARNAIAELAEQAKQDMTPEKILAMDTPTMERFAEKLLPLPGVPKIMPLGVFSFLRSARIMLPEVALSP